MLLNSPVHTRLRIDTTRSQRKGVMAMIDLNRVLNQSLSLVRSNRGPGRSTIGGGLNLRRAHLGLLRLVPHLLVR